MSKFSLLMKSLFWALLILLPAAVYGECTCALEGGDWNRSLALKYKVAAIASILVASTVGVLFPVFGKRIPALSPERSFFFILKAFAAGVILSTGFIHALPDAFFSLTSPCISEKPWEEYPFTGFIAMLAAIGMLMVDTCASSYYRRRSQANTAVVGGGDEERATIPVHTHGAHGHAHGSVPSELDSGKTELLRHRVISQVLGFGILSQSRIIGIALGALESPKTIRTVTVALIFYQFFEGIGLGGCIVQARYNTRAVAIMVFLFALASPTGIAVGIGLANIYSETNPTPLIINGVFSSASAGTFIYMALVNLLSADFMSPKMQNNVKLQLGANAALLTGVGCMCLLAKWI